MNGKNENQGKEQIYEYFYAEISFTVLLDFSFMNMGGTWTMAKLRAHSDPDLQKEQFCRLRQASRSRVVALQLMVKPRAAALQPQSLMSAGQTLGLNGLVAVLHSCAAQRSSNSCTPSSTLEGICSSEHRSWKARIAR